MGWVVESGQRRGQQPRGVLYIERWLKATVQLPEGTRKERAKGDPQGSGISALPGNLYLHYVFDAW